MTTTSLSVLLKDHVPGLYRSDRGLVDVVDALAQAHWNVCVVDAASLAEFHRAVVKALHLGVFYGHNLDALLDVLRELDENTALVWTSWRKLRALAPTDWERLLDVLTTRSEEAPAFAVVLAD